MRGNRNSTPFFIKFDGSGQTVSILDRSKVESKMLGMIMCE